MYKRQGNKLSKIVKLVQVIPPHKASLNEDYIRLEQMALAAKQERVFRRPIQRLPSASSFSIASLARPRSMQMSP